MTVQNTRAGKGWSLFTLRFAATMIWLAACVVAQKYFDNPDAGSTVHLLAVATVVVPFLIAFFAILAWNRKADEYQLLLTQKAMAIGAMSTIVLAVIWHLATRYTVPMLGDWSVLAMPAQAILTALVAAQMFKLRA